MALSLPAKSLRLWGLPAACSLAPHILLRESGLDFQVTILDRARGFDEEFRKLNPKMRVPVLAMGDEVVTEVPAISTAISYMAPEKHLLGSSPAEMVRTYEWLCWLSSSVHAQAFSVLLRPYRFSNDEAMHTAISAKGLENVKNSLGLIEERLKGKHAVGDSFTAVDAFLFVIYRWGFSKDSLDMRKDYPKYTTLFNAVRERPTVQAALAEEGVKLGCD